MDKNIGIGFIIGLLITSTLYIYNSNKFNSYQKGFLYLCILFPPLQWVSIILILIFNKLKYNSSYGGIATSKTKLKFKEYNIQLQNLKDLENRGVISENEFNEKSNNIKKLRIESKLKLSPDFKKLKELFDSDILTEDEFNGKVQILRKKYDSSIQEKNINTENNFEVVSEINDGLYVIIDSNSKYGFADKSYRVIIDPIYDFAYSFSEGLALVKIDNKFGFINKNRKVIIDIIYDKARSFKNGMAEVLIGKKTLYFDTNGKKVKQ